MNWMVAEVHDSCSGGDNYTFQGFPKPGKSYSQSGYTAWIFLANHHILAKKTLMKNIFKTMIWLWICNEVIFLWAPDYKGTMKTEIVHISYFH